MISDRVNFIVENNKNRIGQKIQMPDFEYRFFYCVSFIFVFANRYD